QRSSPALPATSSSPALPSATSAESGVRKSSPVDTPRPGAPRPFANAMVRPPLSSRPPPRLAPVRRSARRTWAPVLVAVALAPALVALVVYVATSVRHRGQREAPQPPGAAARISPDSPR